MNFYVFEGNRIRVRNLIGRAYIDTRDDSVCPVFRDRGGNLYVCERCVLCNPDEYWASLSTKAVYRNELKRVPERSVSDWCPLVDQVENGCVFENDTRWNDGCYDF